MTIIKDLLISPSSDLQALLPAFIVFLFALNVYYISVLLFSNALSLKYLVKNSDLSKYYSDLFTTNKKIMFAFGIIPPIFLAILLRMYILTSGFNFEFHILASAVILLSGLSALYIYNRKKSFISGIAGIVLIFGYLFMISIISSVIMLPEKWPFINSVFINPLFSETPFLIFFSILILSLIIGGGALGFFSFRWSEKKIRDGSTISPVININGNISIIAGTFLFPPLLFLLLYTIPSYTLSKTIFLKSLFIIFTLIILGYYAFLSLKKRSGNNGSTIKFALTIILTLVSSWLLFNFQQNSNSELVRALHLESEERAAKTEAQRTEIYAKNMNVGPEFGAKIFKEKCTSCHDFEKKILGPPFLETVPKYLESPEKMEEFISSPKKINPEYPSMPNPGLTRFQIKAVVLFITDKVRSMENREKGVKIE